MSYLRNYGAKETPQSEPIPGQDQVENNAGGFVYEIDPFARLRRFLILGSEGGTYYTGERKLTRENAECVIECCKLDGIRTVDTIVEISMDARAPKNDQAVFALAMASALGDDATRQYAFENVNNVCRIGTHLFQFVTFREQFAGWGRGMRNAVANWYLKKPIPKLAYQLVKYPQRDGWSHEDLLRLAHPNPEDRERVVHEDMEEMKMLFQWATNRYKGKKRDLPEIVQAAGKALRARTPRATARLIERFRLPREAILTEHRNQPEVWSALLNAQMPMTAMIRNLANMTRDGVITGTSRETDIIRRTLTDAEVISAARIHPANVLLASKTYAAGVGRRGQTWTPVPQILDALDEAFYLAFDNLEPTGARRLIALDISGSMWGAYPRYVAGIEGFVAAEAAGAMSLASMKTGDPYDVVAFTSGGDSYYRSRNSGREIYPGLTPMALSPRQRLDDVDRAMRAMSPFMGATDCALPIMYARENGKEYDVFEIHTDNESWNGGIHASQALEFYRKESGIRAKLIAAAYTATEYSIANPRDPGMLDVVGFDSGAPQIMAQFIQESI
jgi:60 kDa SS-A/Ro ribonucleoprotein